MGKQILFLTFALCLFTFDLAHGATGCSYPTSLDSYSDKSTGDFLTTGDVNSRSCAIEQLEIRLNQVFNGRAGGQTITGGTGASQTLTLSSTSNATKGTIRFGTNGAWDETNGRLGIGTLSPGRHLEIKSANPTMQLLQVDGGTIGPRLDIYHNASTNDVGAIGFFANDSGANTRTTNSIQGWYLDSTATSQDSELRFCVQNNVNAGNCNTVATLS